MNVITPPPTEAEEQPKSVADEKPPIELPSTDTDTKDLTELAAAQITCPACGTSNPLETAHCDECGAALTDDEVTSGSLPALPVGSLISERYQVERLLAQGDCNVYLASFEDETFIVKEGPADTNAFEAEIARLQGVAYPTIARFVEKVDQAQSDYPICTAPPSIAPLHTIHFPSWREVVRAMLSLCQTLQKLHDAGTLLNDFSAVQWNADEGRVFIYELAHSMDVPMPIDESVEVEDIETVWADANFAAPEVQRHLLTEIGFASDLYALAALGYQLLFGKRYASPTLDVSPPSNEDRPIVAFPPALYRAVLTCLHSNPTERLDSVEAFKDELIPLHPIQCHRWDAGSDVGQRREQNQDAYFAQSTVLYAQSKQVFVGLYLVADGMGGAKAGDLASHMVVEACRKSWGEMLCSGDFAGKTEAEWLSWIGGVLQEANAEIIDAAGGDEMGSTATLCLALNQRAYFAHVGDSRAYLIHGGEIEQLTDDHSLVARLVRMGQLTPAQAANHPQKHIIYKTLGGDREVEVDCFMRPLSTDHALLICSDGLHGMVNDDQLIRVLSDENLEHTEKISALINGANAAGGMDNITAVYVTFH